MGVPANPPGVVIAQRRLADGGVLSWLARGAAELGVLRWLVPLAVLHGLLYLAIIPPWQHYDETAHFLFAAEIAAGEIDVPGPASAAISREIADSMYRFRFYPPEVRPDLFGPTPPVVGISQRVHPPFYYATVALPLRFLSALSIEQQLYAARTVSLAFSVLTILATWRLAVALVPDEPIIQRMLPLLVMVVPAFADIMTAVNNDVLLNFSVTVSLLGAVLCVRDGPRLVPLLLALLGITVALMAKRTALVACLPLALALVWSVQRTPLRWVSVFLIGVTVVTVVGVATLEPLTVEGLSGPHTLLGVRPWFATIADGYMRLNLDAVVRSFTDLDLIGNRYRELVIIGFSGFYGHFGWGQVHMPQAWTWALAGLAGVAMFGLLLGGGLWSDVLPLWQRRCLWIFLLAVVVGWFSLFVRLHPLPALTMPIYFPRGRYMFWAIVPNMWLLALGIGWASPKSWRPYMFFVVLCFFVCLDLTAVLWTIVNYYYR